MVRSKRSREGANNRCPNARTAIRIARAVDGTVEDLFGAATPGETGRE